jgi:DNA polymerase V
MSFAERAAEKVRSAKHGRGSVGLGLAGKNQDWRMRRENLSPSFTTKWEDLAKVVMG